MRTQHTQKKGFTLIETLVAVAILLMVVTTVFSVAQLGLSSTSNIRNRFVAIFLAQEAIEGIKNIKDSNLLANSQPGADVDWLTGLLGQGECSSIAVGCGYDVVTGTTVVCDWDGGDCSLRLQTINGYDFYRQGSFSGGLPSDFSRTIYFQETIDGEEAKVRVVIGRPDAPNFFEVETVIYNWF